MPVELIPNQPIIFQDPIGQYPCLNNDPRQYAVLMQEDDQLCMQWKLLECTPDVMCEPNMVMDPVGTDELGAWTVTDDWSTTGSDELTFDGTANAGGDATQSLSGLVVGAVYKLTFNVQTFTGGQTLQIEAANQFYIVTEPGIYDFYFIANNDPFDIDWYMTAMTTTAADQISIIDIELLQTTDCWLDDLFEGVASWTYSYTDGQGKFCSSVFEDGDLINTNAFVNTGNYHGVSLTIDNCTQGGLQVYLGGVLFGTTSGNGNFQFYGTPTSGTDLTLVKTGDFNGCVSLVSVKDYGDISGYYVQMYDNDSSNFVNATPVTAYDDRIVLCTTIEDLDWEFGVPECANITVELTEGCNSTEYTSVNTINWNQTGHECTKVVEAWNDGYAFGFYFGDVAAPDFKLIHRLRVLAFNPVYQNAAEEYLYSSGNRGRSFAQSQKARTAWFDYCDEFAHDVIRLQLLSQKLFIDNYAFFYPVADYEPEWNDRGKYNLAQSRVTVFHEETVFGSTCGTFVNAICPPQLKPYSKVILKASTSYGQFDYTAIIFSANSFDPTGAGIITPAITALYDLTNPAEVLILENDIKTVINAVYGGTTTGTLTFTPTSNLTFDFEMNLGSTTILNALSFSMDDANNNQGVSYSTTVI